MCFALVGSTEGSVLLIMITGQSCFINSNCTRTADTLKTVLADALSLHGAEGQEFPQLLRPQQRLLPKPALHATTRPIEPDVCLCRGRSRQARTRRANARNDVDTASLGRVFRHLTNIGRPAVKEVSAELLGFFQAALNAVGAHSAEAVISVARVHLGAGLAASHLHKEGTALDSVDEDVTRREHSVRGPGSEVVDGGAAARESVILRVDVEESNLKKSSCEQRTGHSGLRTRSELELHVPRKHRHR